MSMAKIIAELVNRGEEDLANELIAQGPHGKRQGPRDGSGPNPNCPLKSEDEMTDEEIDEELEDESQAASPAGKPQKLIMDYLGRPGGGSVDLTDMSSHPSFRGIHFVKIQKAAEVLDKKGMIKFDGAKLSKADADIDAELDDTIEAMSGPHLFAVDCVQWPSSKKADYKPWKEAVKEWASTDHKKCEVIDQEGESVDPGATFRAARKFGVMRADMEDAEIDAELDAALAESY